MSIQITLLASLYEQITTKSMKVVWLVIDYALNVWTNVGCISENQDVKNDTEQ